MTKTLIGAFLAFALAAEAAPVQQQRPQQRKPGQSKPTQSKQSKQSKQTKPAAKDDASGPPSKVCGAEGLSEVRQKMFAELDLVIPSIQGVKKGSGRNLFDGVARMTEAKYAQLKAKKAPIVTTCGLLPGIMLRRLGMKGLLQAGGTEGVRICGKALGSDVYKTSEDGSLPKPGDIYWLRYPKTPKTDNVAHVGIICRTGDETWKTVDAGQGAATQQAALIVTRDMKKVDGKNPFLAGPGYVGDARDLRRLGGWLDLDALMEAEAMAKAAKLKLTVKGYNAICK